jgi:hypothetical protein
MFCNSDKWHKNDGDDESKAWKIVWDEWPWKVAM